MKEKRMSARPIFETLRHLRGGVCLDEASEALADLVRCVDATGKPGKLTIELTLKKATRGGALVAVDKVTVKKPAEQPMETLFFANAEGNLLTENPAQGKLELRQVEGTTVDQPLNTVATAA
jgi:hypothetical protein